MLNNIRIILIAFTLLSVEIVMANDNINDATSPQKAWDSVYSSIEKQISEPKFNNLKINITKYGAKKNNPKFLNTSAINTAIKKCNEKGGGTVIVPEGIWYTGPITLKSNVNLYLSKGAKILFSSDKSKYPVVITRWEGIDCYNYQPMIYAFGETNIAITGKGTIDGGASNENWWAMCGASQFGWKEGIISQKIGRPLLSKYNDEERAVEKRWMGKGFGLRPQLINFYKCSNVLMDGVTLLRSPFWVIHPLLSQNLIFRNLHIQNEGPNGDGCDPESCKNVLIENCYFDTGDDCVAIKSGRNNDGRKWNIPSENIIIRNSRMKNGHGGVVIGSEISGGFRNLFVDNCKMDSPLLERVIRIKTNTCRGGIIQNVYVRNITVGVCKESILRIDMLYEAKENCCRNFPPTVRNIFLDSINSSKSKYAIYISALKETGNVYNINVSNCFFNGVEKGNLIDGKTADIHFSNFYINKQLVEKL